MAHDSNQNRFIPFRKADIVSMCCDDSRMDAGDAQEFGEFCRIIEALFHLELSLPPLGVISYLKGRGVFQTSPRPPGDR